jgi:hypothetical protein
LYDLNGTLITPLTTHTAFEVANSSRSKANVLVYTARDGDNFLMVRLHRVALDGAGKMRLTDPAFDHTIGSCVSGVSGRTTGGSCAFRRTTSISWTLSNPRHSSSRHAWWMLPPAVITQLARSD